VDLSDDNLGNLVDHAVKSMVTSKVRDLSAKLKLCRTKLGREIALNKDLKSTISTLQQEVGDLRREAELHSRKEEALKAEINQLMDENGMALQNVS
ncbi:hypothetical protein FOZ62_015851, partial [Perkinsus olseni]